MRDRDAAHGGRGASTSGERAGVGRPLPGRRAFLGVAATMVGLGLRSAHGEEPDAFATLEAGFAARGRSPEAFAALEMRLSRTRPTGIAVFDARPGLPITPDAVRRRYGPAQWSDVRPELPTFY